MKAATLLRLALELIGARVFLSFRRDLSLAWDAVTRGGQIAYTSAGPIEYSENGAGIAVLSIHGAGGGYDQGLANAADLLGEGFRIIAPSRPAGDYVLRDGALGAPHSQAA